MPQIKKAPISTVEPLIEEYKGNIAAVARKLGVNRSTIWNRVKESATLRAKLDDARETMLDNAESALYSQVLNGNTTALIFFLKTQGKTRGYTERHELTGSEGSQLLPGTRRHPDDFTDEELATIAAGSSIVASTSQERAK